MLFLVSILALASSRRLGHGYGALNRGLHHRGVDPFVTRPQDPPEQWFRGAIVDHFTRNGSTNWSQRFFVNDTFFKPGGPIFLFLGGEGPLTGSWLTGAFVVNEYAQKLNGLVVGIEHRYYGNSQPEPKNPLDLTYLSSAQAIRDVGVFQQWFVSSYLQPKGSQFSPWVAVGGSYSGNLAAWVASSYPTVFSGSLASSAPVFAVENFVAYFDVVTTSVGHDCAARISKAYESIVDLYKTQAGQQRLTSMFKACNPIRNTTLDYASFLEATSGGVAEIVQYNNDNRASTSWTINKMCSIINDKTKQPLDAFADFNNQFLSSYGATCLSVSYADVIADLKQPGADRSWTYQTCNEFGYYQTGDGPSIPNAFPKGIDLEFFLAQCEEVFQISPSQVSGNVNATNNRYGDFTIGDWVHNVYFANGEIDPWHALGVLPSFINPRSHPEARGVHARLMKTTAHCADMYAPNPADPPELVETRAQQFKWINTWIGNQ